MRPNFRLPQSNEETRQRQYFQLADAIVTIHAIKNALIAKGHLTEVEIQDQRLLLEAALSERLGDGAELLGALEDVFRQQRPSGD